MLHAKFDQRLVMRFHSFLMGEFHNPKVMQAKDLTVNIELAASGLTYQLDGQRVDLRHCSETEVDAFALRLYKDGAFVQEFKFSEIMFYEARNVFLNWLLYDKIDYTQPVMKMKKRVTAILDDKPYGDVDIAVHISSSLEDMSLYRKFKGYDWTYEQDNGGYLHTIGHHGEMPVCVSPMVHTIEGVKVMYVEATSMVVDWEMVDKWIRDRCTKDGLVIETDPNNLCNAIRSKIRAREEAK